MKSVLLLTACLALAGYAQSQEPLRGVGAYNISFNIGTGCGQDNALTNFINSTAANVLYNCSAANFVYLYTEFTVFACDDSECGSCTALPKKISRQNYASNSDTFTSANELSCEVSTPRDVRPSANFFYVDYAATRCCADQASLCLTEGQVMFSFRNVTSSCRALPSTAISASTLLKVFPRTPAVVPPPPPPAQAPLRGVGAYNISFYTGTNCGSAQGALTTFINSTAANVLYNCSAANFVYLYTEFTLYGCDDSECGSCTAFPKKIDRQNYATADNQLVSDSQLSCMSYNVRAERPSAQFYYVDYAATRCCANTASQCLTSGDVMFSFRNVTSRCSSLPTGGLSASSLLKLFPRSPATGGMTCPVEVPENGYIVGGLIPRISEGQNVTYACYAGQQTGGDMVRFCRNGMLTGSRPTCPKVFLPTHSLAIDMYIDQPTTFRVGNSPNFLEFQEDAAHGFSFALWFKYAFLLQGEEATIVKLGDGLNVSVKDDVVTVMPLNIQFRSSHLLWTNMIISFGPDGNGYLKVINNITSFTTWFVSSAPALVGSQPGDLVLGTANRRGYLFYAEGALWKRILITSETELVQQGRTADAQPFALVHVTPQGKLQGYLASGPWTNEVGTFRVAENIPEVFRQRMLEH